MNLEKVIFGFFIILAMTLNFGFVIGELDNPVHHHVYELFVVVVVNLIATVLKFGEHTQIGLIERNALTKPYYAGFVLGMHRVNNQASRYTPKHLMHLVDLLPPDTVFSVVAIGKIQFEAITLSLLLGGNARVGSEDNIYVSKGKLPESIAHLVAKIVRIAKEIGREIASPSVARERLGIPKWIPNR